MLESIFHCCPEVCRETTHLHILFDFLPQYSLMATRIQGYAIVYLSPIFFRFLTEKSRDITAVEVLMEGAGIPVIMAELDDVHLMIIQQSYESQLASMPFNIVECSW
jgi:hypothetical protein